jgi:hypothetical protein
MAVRNARIAWSVAWGVVAVLLVGLWVRSYSWWDAVGVPTNHMLVSMQGNFLWDHSVAMTARPAKTMPTTQTGIVNSLRLDDIIIWPMDARVEIFDSSPMTVPIWWAVVAAVLIGGAAWAPVRFSLRTLLVATAVVAVGLGVGIGWFRQ